MTVILPENAKDLIESSVFSGIQNLGFQVREVHTNFPTPIDDFQIDRAVNWSAEVEMLVEQPGSETEINGVKYNNVAPQWVMLSSRLHYLPTDDGTPVDSYQISESAMRSAAFTVLIAMRPDRRFIYRAIQDYGIHHDSLFVAETIRLGRETVDNEHGGGKLMDPAKVLAFVCDFIRTSTFQPISEYYKARKAEKAAGRE